jgi:ABC-type nitrate/sulfonate/bicarbonate transport system permease component
VKGLNAVLGAAGLAAFLALGEAVPRLGIVEEAYFPPTSRAVDSVMADTARSYGVKGVARLRHVVLRSASPQIFAGLRQALSVGIILMVISEMFAASNGIGFTVVQFQRSFAIAGMWTGILVLGLLGFVLSVLFQLVERRVLGWYHGLRASHRSSP